MNAFYALWSQSETAFAVSCLGEDAIARYEDEVSTPEKVEALLRKGKTFSSAGGRAVKADFSAFPLIEISLFDEAFGKGAAQCALEWYAGIPSDERFYVGDKY